MNIQKNNKIKSGTKKKPAGKKKPTGKKKPAGKKKSTGKKKVTSNNWKLSTAINNNKAFSFVIVALIFSFMWIVTLNRPVEGLDRKGISFLNKYEYPSYLTEEGNCMYPYDVGDGVITFGPGITYPTIEAGIEGINNQLGTKYSVTDSCIKTSDLMDLQKKILVKYENVILNVENDYVVSFTQDQFNALVLLSYNSPNLFKNHEFLKVITNSESTYEQYVEAADNYYRQLRGYDTHFGEGWYNRIKDSGEMYYFGDYRYQNNLEEK